jgi:hypothetical protein
MGFRSAADGITKQGKTKGKNLGNDGASVGIKKVLSMQVLKVVKRTLT